MNKVSRSGYCTLCTSTCGAIYEIEDDRIISVRNNPGHPTGQAMCLKGKAAAELVDSPSRLRQPMRRTKPKGSADPGWQVISWDDALDEIAQRMRTIKQESGAHSVAFGITTPNGTPISDSNEWIERFIYKFGSPNICYAAEICNWHKEIAHSFTFGCGMPAPDYAHSDLIILWGHNPTNTWLAQAHAIGEARKAGARLIVIDPRDTALARDADVWLRLRPGTDAALAMGLANAAIGAGSFDKAFVKQWSNGALLVRHDNGAFVRGSDVGLIPESAWVYWDSEKNTAALLPVAEPGQANPVPDFAALSGIFELQDAQGSRFTCSTSFDCYSVACEPFSFQHTVNTTWVDETALMAATALIASSQRIALHSWTGVEQSNNATQSLRAISCLYALTGSFDKEGGNRIFGKLPSLAVNEVSILSQTQLEHALGYAERPIGPAANAWVTARDLYHAINEEQPYKVRALISFGGNLLLSQADTADAVRAFESLEFHVHCDLFMNPTAEYADIVLPVNSPWEREALRIGFGISTRAQEWVQLRPQMVSSRAESRSDSDIVFALASRLGLRSEFFDGSIERGWNAMLEPLGLDVEQLRASPEGIRIELQHPTQKYRNSGFNTATHLVELYSQQLLDLGYQALPGFIDVDILQPSEEFPYVLSCAKSGYFCHSQHRGIASLRRKSKSPTIEMSDLLAVEHGIVEHDWVEVRTRNGMARFRAKINERLHPKVVFGEYGWWQPCDPLGASGMPFQGPLNSNYNGLIDTQDKDPVSGSMPLRAFTCSLRREMATDEQPRRWSGFQEFYVSEIETEVDGVKRVHLRPRSGERLPDFEVGQHITLRFNVAPGASVTRAYSLVGSALRSYHDDYVICVRNSQSAGVENPVPPSASHYINCHLAKGDRVDLQAPGGHFTLPVHSDRPIVFYAGGIGITPFITALETAAFQRSTAEFLLLYVNRNAAGHVFKRRLKVLEEQLPGLKIIDIYSRPDPTDRQGVDYQFTGYLNIQYVPVDYLMRQALHYMCGADGMMADMTAALIKVGVPRHDIFKEAFKSSVDMSNIPSGTFNVTFSRSGKTLSWDNRCGPLLDFAEKMNILLPSGCRVGQCESCAVNVTKGQVLHLQGQPDDENVCLTCQAIPISDITLDI